MMQTDWFKILAVGSGGFIGATSRYLISSFMQSRFSESHFPFGTLTVNLLGCLIIGILAGWFESRSWAGPEWRLFLFVGVLGGFTTFSTFSHETLLLWENAKIGLAFLNLGAQIIFGIFFVWLGYLLIRLFH